jgi:hypothetical protein
MRKILKETLLYVLVGLTSIFSIAFLGIIGLPNSIGGKITLWLLAGILSYSILYLFHSLIRKTENIMMDFS